MGTFLLTCRENKKLKMNINIGLVAIIFSIVVSPEIPFLGKGIRAEDILFVFVFLAWIVSMTLKRKRWIYTDLNLPIFLIIFVNFLSLLNGYIFGNLHPVYQTSVSPLFSFFFFLKKVMYYGLFFVVVNQVKNIKEVKFYTVFILIAATCASLFGIYLSIVSGIEYRVASPFDEQEANTFGQFLVFHILIALSLLFSVKILGQKILLILFLGLSFYCFQVTYSRGSYAALAIGLLFFGIVKERKILLIILFFAIFYSLILPETVIERVISGYDEIYRHLTGEFTESSFSARVFSFEEGFSYALKNPILGYGIGVVPMQRIEAQLPFEAMTTGFTGLFLFLWIIWRIAKICWHNFKQARDNFIKSLSFGLLCGLIGYMISGLSAVPFTTIRTAEPFWMVCGLVFVLHKIIKEEKEGLEFVPYEILAHKIYKIKT